MEEKMNFQIRNFGPINSANLEIGKINIVGGHNATGKSSASKLLYCFLKAGSNKRQDFAYESLSSSLISLIGALKDDIRHFRKVRGMDFLELLELYEDSKEEYYTSDDYVYSKFIEKDIESMDDFIEEIQANSDSFYLSMLSDLLRIEFKNINQNSSVSVSDEFDKNMVYINSLFSDSIDSIDKLKLKSYLNIYDVFYVDTFSLFDLDRLPSRIRLRRRSYYDHVDYLRFKLKDSESDTTDMIGQRNKNHKAVLKKVQKIIGGNIVVNRNRFMYVSENSEECSMGDTASGIKQIGIIQLLLSNYLLKEDSFLIMDEPEVNLHPEWQFKLAEILVILVKYLNISIYVNSHSPMFIEAIEVFTKYYDLEEYTNFYLTERFDKSSFNFTKIDYDELYKLYDNLSEPFDSIEVYRLKSEYKRGNY